MATLKDVARQAGLSVTTASRALNNYDDVAAATRERVQAVARALDYHPNATARSLQGSHTSTVGLMIPRIRHRAHNAFWLEFIGGLAATCAARGFDVLLSTSETHDVAPGLQRVVHGRRVDGLLVCDIRCHDPRIAYLQERRLPFVAFGRTVGTLDFPYLDVDGTAGVRQAIEHLIALGHRRIAYLGLEMEFGFSHFRYLGYRKALEGAGAPCDATLIHHGVAEEDIPALMAGLLAAAQRPTAVFASADYLALGVVKAARGAGMRVPDDLSVATFDDTLLVQHADPPLTAVSQSNQRLGEEAAGLLLDRVMGPALPLVQRLIVPALVARQSTGPPHAAAP
jgi:DNA-binding LacI/PurR family transcriptional regulator